MGVLVAIAALCVVGGVLANESRPSRGRVGAEAEAMTSALERVADVDAWRRTGAVSFGFLGQHEHLWDRERRFVRIRWGGREAQLPLEGGRAVLRVDGHDVVATDERRAMREKAFAMFYNDAFWLVPFEKLRDEGVTRSVVTRHGRPALLVEYASGGTTPGDAYVWMPARDGHDLRWAMFVKVLPIGGIEVGWTGWRTLSTGARVATRRRNAAFDVAMIDHPRGAATLRELVGDEDPFADLVRANASR